MCSTKRENVPQNIICLSKFTFQVNSYTKVFYNLHPIHQTVQVLLYCPFFSISSVQLLSRVRLFVTPWTAAHQASLSITNSWSPPKLMSIELVMLFNHLILCRPHLLLSSVPPSIRVFSNESALCIRWPKYWSFSFNISPSNEHSGLISISRSLVIIKPE